MYETMQVRQAGSPIGPIVSRTVKSACADAYDLQLSREVQARSFPQAPPRVATLSYAGACLPAREVGGDFYDFMDMGAGHLGIVLADVSGKGIAAALQMASLQAQLRTHVSLGVHQIPELLHSVNRLFYECTPAASYATLFFAEYAEDTQILRYANCGHPSPLLLRANGRVERLESCAMVLGLSRELSCPSREIQLAAGDTLVLYTDGVTEAMDSAGEEFGDAGLLGTVRKGRGVEVPELLKSIIDAVHGFSAGEASDDLTVIAARCEGRLQ